jgi:hypothetical protein
MKNNMFFYVKEQGGFIQIVVLLVIALIVLGYFGFNIQNILESGTVKKNLEYSWGLVKNFWNNFLSKPFHFVWDKIIIDIGVNGVTKLIKLIPFPKTQSGE